MAMSINYSEKACHRVCYSYFCRLASGSSVVVDSTLVGASKDVTFTPRHWFVLFDRCCQSV
jgi:hypothetical protein